MKWLTLDYIKQHSRIDFDCEDNLLELYSDAAEEVVMNTLDRDYDDIVENFGTASHDVPAAIMQASLMLVDLSYTNRSPVSPQNMSIIPYGFDLLLKRYIKLAD